MLIHELSVASCNILEQNAGLIKAITDADYCHDLPLLSGNTIGKHIRHVLEIYHELLKGIPAGTVNYDARQRDLHIEQDRAYALRFISLLQEQLSVLKVDKSLWLHANYETKGGALCMQTTLGRELAYNLEHAIHHMAIIQIVVRHQFNYISLPHDFGIAFSTRQYLKQHVHTHLPANT